MHILLCDDYINEFSSISSLLEDCRRKRNNSITYKPFHCAADLLEAKRRDTF